MNLSQLKQFVISELYKAVQQKDYGAVEFLSKVYQRICRIPVKSPVESLSTYLLLQRYRSNKQTTN